MNRPDCSSRIFTAVLTMALMLLVSSGCSGIRNDYPEKTTFRLAARAATASAPDLKSGSPLLVRQLGISPEFESDAFVYRTSQDRFRSDFYHSFVVPPARIITDILSERLYASDRFTPARNSSPHGIRYQLSGKILELYADLRDKAGFSAVLSMRLMLEADTGKGFEPVVHELYRETIPFSVLSPDLYIDSLNAGLSHILTRFFSDLDAAGIRRSQ